MSSDGNSKSEPKPESALKSFLSGGVGGVCAVLVGHPLDLVKVRIQTGDGGSTMQVLRSSFAQGGVRGLYRGVSAPMLSVAPCFAVSFWGYDMGKRFVSYFNTNDEPNRPSNLSVTQLCIAGFLSAIPMTAIMAPTERIKCLLQVQANEVAKGGKGKYSGIRDCATQLFKEGGIRSIYKGTFVTILRDGPGSAAYFGVYELAKREISRAQGLEPGDLSPVAVLTAGGLAGMGCWIVQIPADTIKSRYQTAPEGMYNGLFDVYKKLISDEGPAGLFRGLRPALLRAFPANAACFYGMEVARRALSFMD